jgi:hypothetical protein
LGVDRDADNFDAALFEFGQPVIEGNQFGRAYKRKIERVKENDRIFSIGLGGQGEIADFIVGHDGGCCEIRGLLANEYGHNSSPSVGFEQSGDQ